MMRKSARTFILFSLLMLLLSINPTYLIARALSTSVSLTQLTTVPPSSTGRAPRMTKPVRDSGDMALALSFVHAAFAVDVYPNEYFRYIPDADSPGTWLSVGDVAGTAYYAGDFVGNDFSQVYVIEFNLNELHTLDTATGTATTIGACTPIPGHVWTGATGTVDGTLYASSTNDAQSYLYTVDIASGTATAIGEITNAPTIIDIAINADGEMYGVEISTDNLVQIDPATGAGTVIGSIGFDANYAQGMDFEPVSGVLYLAAYNATAGQGELRIANTATGNSVLVGAFLDGAETDALAFTPSPSLFLQNPGFEDGWSPWDAEGAPILSSTSHSGSLSVLLSGEVCWVWQYVYIPADALDVSFGYWITGVSSDTEWDNDILVGGIWNLTRQTKYVDVRFGLTYFYSYPGVWKEKLYRLNADELANVAGQWVAVGFWLIQDWNPGYHKTSSAIIDDAVLYVTRPIYDNFVYLPLIVR